MITAARLQDRASAEDREIVSASVGSNDLQQLGEDAEAIEALRGRLMSTAPQQFEHLIKALLLKTGSEQVSVTKYSNGSDKSGWIRSEAFR